MIMSDKDILLNSICIVAGKVSSSLFGLKIGTCTAGLIKAGVNNMIKKDPYKTAMDFFFDEEDNLITTDDFFGAFKEILDQKPLKWKVPMTSIVIGFNGKDIEDIKQEFLKAKNL